MNKEQIIKCITSVLNTLNNIKISGYDDIDRMYGCMQLLQKLGGEIAKLEIKESGDSGN